MECKLQKWGNSVGIRIPKSMLKELNWQINDLCELKIEERNLIMAKKEKTISLEERFENYNGDNLSEDFVWDEPQGKEIW